MIIVAKALLIYKDRFLIVRRSETHPLYAFQYDLPGGTANRNEASEVAASREVREEVGIDLKPTDYLLVYEKDYGTHHRHHIYRAVLGTDQPKVKLSWEHDKFFWLDKEELLSQSYPKDLDPYFADVLDYLKNEAKDK